jgi:hypothetical protein
MSYLTQAVIADDYNMFRRVAQAVATEGYEDADSWTSLNKRDWAAAPGWDAAWESALASHPDDDQYQPGADEAVITDGMILSQIQGMLEPSDVINPTA